MFSSLPQNKSRFYLRTYALKVIKKNYFTNLYIFTRLRRYVHMNAYTDTQHMHIAHIKIELMGNNWLQLVDRSIKLKRIEHR